MTDPVTPEPNPYQSPQANPYASPSGAPKAPVLSIISLISGIVGLLSAWFYIGIVFGIAAVVLGHLGQRKEPQAKGFWLTGLITGYLGIVVSIGWIIFTVVFASFIYSQLPAEYNY